jgi:hypothetical protein
VPLAAVLDQEREQLSDPLDVDGVDDAPLIAPGAEQTRAFELREVRRHGRCRNTQALGDPPRGQADRPFAHEQPEHA